MANGRRVHIFATVAKEKVARVVFARRRRCLSIAATKRAAWSGKTADLRAVGAENAGRLGAYAKAFVIVQSGLRVRAANVRPSVKRLRVVRVQKSATQGQSVSEVTEASAFVEKSQPVKTRVIVRKVKRVSKADAWGENRLCTVVQKRDVLRGSLAEILTIRVGCARKHLLVCEIAIAAFRDASKVRKDAPKSWLVVCQASVMSNAVPKKADVTRTQESVWKGQLAKRTAIVRVGLVSKSASCAKRPKGSALAVSASQRPPKTSGFAAWERVCVRHLKAA